LSSKEETKGEGEREIRNEEKIRGERVAKKVKNEC